MPSQVRHTTNRGKNDSALLLRWSSGWPGIFFFSGLAGLGCQVAWAKAFSSGIGHEFPAVLAVVTSFMAGMALGASCFERLPSRIKDDPRCYGWLELAIALWGATSAFAIPALNAVILHLLGPDPLPMLHWTVVFGAVFIGLLPATACMGATFPPFEQFLSRTWRKDTTGVLYAANTAGAVSGALVAAFCLMPLFGIRNSILLFATLNLLCGLLSLGMLRSKRAQFGVAARHEGRRSDAAEKTPFPSEPGETSRSGQWLLGVRLFFTGLLALGFETVSLRALSQVLENTVYTFAVVLAVYLAGNALGAAAFQRLSEKKCPRADHLLLSLAITSLLAGAIFRWMPSFYEHLRDALGDSLSAVAFSESLTALAVLGLPCFLMGGTFTSLAQSSLIFRPTLSWSLALNTLGGAVSPLIFGLLVVPMAGLKAAITLIAMGYLLLLGKSRCLFALPIIALAAPVLTGSNDLIERNGQRLVSFKEGPMGSVSVLENTNSQRVLKVNNRFQMGGTAARIAEERQADIPLLLHPRPHRAMIIGLGTGITFGAAANYPDLMVDGIELLPGVVDSMPYFADDRVALQDSHASVHIADGRRFVLTTTNSYDVIIGDLFHPAQDGTGFLYTREHFAAIRSRLAENGLFCQWLPVYQMDPGTIAIVMKTFLTVFPNAESWLLRFNIDTPVVGLIGWRAPPAFTPNWVEEKLGSSETLHEHLRRVGLADTVRLFGCRLGSISSSATVQNARVNTDEKPVVIFLAPAITFRRRDDNPSPRLLALVRDFESPESGFKNPALRKRLASYTAARDLYLQGLSEEDQGRAVEAVSLYIQSARLSEDFTSGYAQALAIATSMAATKRDIAERILTELAEAQPKRPVAREILERLKTQP
ncbi:MAG TPA: fused MFS/spermidine synthase [Verrucomicrobiae bacterium]|nr:fused MFS/spermidine synthase [Verrucomicrobiae bacterium]